MDEKVIRQKVDSILQETDLDVAPISIISIAKFYGFSVYEMDLGDQVSGLIMVDEKKIKGYDSSRIIVVNSKHSVGRRRFTIAHELGHYFLDDCPTKCYAHRDNGDYSPKERDANSFASMLLMPEDEIKRFAKHYFGDDDEMSYYIAQKFNVSQSAAEVRLKKLELI